MTGDAGAVHPCSDSPHYFLSSDQHRKRKGSSAPGLWRESKYKGWGQGFRDRKTAPKEGLSPRFSSHILCISDPRIGFAIARRLAQDGAHVVVSSRKQENVDRAVATLQGEELSVTGTVCHVGKAEDRERLVATVRGERRALFVWKEEEWLFLKT